MALTGYRCLCLNRLNQLQSYELQAVFSCTLEFRRPGSGGMGVETEQPTSNLAGDRLLQPDAVESVRKELRLVSPVGL